MHLLLMGACSDGAPDSDEDTGDGGDSDPQETGDTGDTAADTGSSEDTAADTGDSGTDTGDSGDTATDTGDSGDTATDTGDSGDTGEACSPADFDYIAEVRDAKGTAGTSFSAKEELTLAGVVKNPCSEDVTFETPSSCLVASWTTTSSSGMGMGAIPTCLTVITSWTVPAGGSVEETLYWGRMSPDDWEASLVFDVKKRPTAVLKFTVY